MGLRASRCCASGSCSECRLSVLSEADIFILSMLGLTLNFSGALCRKTALCLISAEEPPGGFSPPAGTAGVWKAQCQCTMHITLPTLLKHTLRKEEVHGDEHDGDTNQKVGGQRVPKQCGGK